MFQNVFLLLNKLTIFLSLSFEKCSCEHQLACDGHSKTKKSPQK